MAIGAHRKQYARCLTWMDGFHSVKLFTPNPLTIAQCYEIAKASRTIYFSRKDIWKAVCGNYKLDSMLFLFFYTIFCNGRKTLNKNNTWKIVSIRLCVIHSTDTRYMNLFYDFFAFSSWLWRIVYSFDVNNGSWAPSSSNRWESRAWNLNHTAMKSVKFIVSQPPAFQLRAFQSFFFPLFRRDFLSRCCYIVVIHFILIVNFKLLDSYLVVVHVMGKLSKLLKQ